LKPTNQADYAVAFSPAEVARLNTIFPNGVCDWSKPGVNQTGVVAFDHAGHARAIPKVTESETEGNGNIRPTKR
jgi:hypothetical protein